jgi:hypothetical protein
MRDLVRLIVWTIVDLFRSRAAFEAEILTLRQQIIVLRRTAPKKQSFGAIDRLVFVGLDCLRSIARSVAQHYGKVVRDCEDFLAIPQSDVSDTALRFAMGQAGKNSVRAPLFRFTLKLGHCSALSALRS